MRNFLCLLLLSFLATAVYSQYVPMTSYGYHLKRLKPDSVLHIPVYINDSALHTSDTSSQFRLNNGVLQYHYGWWRNIVGGGGILALSQIGTNPNANAGTITGTVLNLEPASITYGGSLSPPAVAQTFAGIKTHTQNSNNAFTFNGAWSSGSTGQSHLVISPAMTATADNIYLSALNFSPTLAFGVHTGVQVYAYTLGTSIGVNYSTSFGLDRLAHHALNANYGASFSVVANGNPSETGAALEMRANNDTLNGFKILGLNNDHKWILTTNVGEASGGPSSPWPIVFRVADSSNWSNVPDMLTLYATGQARLNLYGAGTYAGTPTGLLGVDANGYIIKTDVAGGGGITSESDPIALAKTITLNAGTNISITGTATQALSTNPSWTINATATGIDTTSLSNRINLKQDQLNGTGFVKASGTTIGYDNSTYLTANQAITVTATGDATGTSTSSATAPSLPLVLATVNSNVGTFGSASKTVTETVNAKGLTTVISEQNILIAESQVTNLVADLAAKGTGTVTSIATTDATGIKGGTITGTGTLFIDTTILSTRAWRDKLADSLAALIGTKQGIITLAAIGSTPNANGATISGSTLNLQPADTTFGGVLTTGAQSLKGVKKLYNSGIGNGLTSLAVGLQLINNSPATVSVDQYSPMLDFMGYGWKSNTTAASQEGHFAIRNKVITGAGGATSQLEFLSVTNAATPYTQKAILTDAGALTTTGTITAGSGTGTFVGNALTGGGNLTISSLANGNSITFKAGGQGVGVFNTSNYFILQNGGTLPADPANGTQFSIYEQASFTTGIGTVGNAASGTTVTGTGTFFQQQYQVGDQIQATGGTPETRTISAIASNTSMTTDAWTNIHTASPYYALPVGNLIRFNAFNNGKVGIRTQTPTAYLTLPAGLADATFAPLKFIAGTNLTTLEDGAVEFDGTHLYITIGGVRKQLDN